MKKVTLLTIAFIITLFSFFSCTKDANNTVKPTYSFGWEVTEDGSNAFVSINSQLFSLGSGNLPASVDLKPYMPPIGNQGVYGTCVAWAAGYYARTIAEAVIKGFNSTQLSSPINQFSPKYLFLSIPNNLKGANCAGTQISYALESMKTGGISNLSLVPYNNLGDCSSSLLQSNWLTEAQTHKIERFNAISKSIQAIKIELASKRAVIIASRLPDEFMNWNNGSAVLSQGASYSQYGGPGHALTIVGYDDAKQAFQIANSWGSSWGDNGYIWIDYNYAINTFIAAGNLYTLEIPTITPTPTPSSTVDVASVIYSDIQVTNSSTGLPIPGSRVGKFNIENKGTTSIQPNGWRAYFMYYNARNPNDYGIAATYMFQNTITDGGGQVYSVPPGDMLNVAGNINAANIVIEPGKKLSDYLPTFSSSGFILGGYDTPLLNGDYFIVLSCDPTNNLNDVNRNNNMFYSTPSPLHFVNGIAQ